MRILELHAPYFRDRWRLEHEVLAWGPAPHCDLPAQGALVTLDEVLRQLPRGWVPDLIVYGDDSRMLRVRGLEDPPCPVVLLSVDAHHHASWHAPLAAACDLVFVAQRDYLPAYEAAGAPSPRWLPLWAPDDLPAPAAERTHDVAFVGTLDARLNPERVALVEALRARLPLHVAQGGWHEVFARSRIVLNQTVRGDLNFRVFEAMASGALLLTERTGNGLLDLFTDGEDLVTYPRDDLDALVATARRYLAAEHDRVAIAERGRERVRAAHLESHRAAEVLAHAARVATPRPAAVRRTAMARAFCALAAHAGRLVEAEPANAALRHLRALYLATASCLARSAEIAEPDRRALLGHVALQSGESQAAVEHLRWAAEHGALLEDRLAYIEALVQARELRRARAAAATLRAQHPEYPLGALLVGRLGRLAAAAERESAVP